MPELSGMIQEFLEGSIKSKGRTPVVNALNVTENGTYTPESGVDGFAPVVVNVPVVPPVIDSISIFANGEYEAPDGIDGYSPIIVDVPQKIETTLNVTENGTYTPVEGYSYNGAIVNVPSVGRVVIADGVFYQNGEYLTVNYNFDTTKYYGFMIYDNGYYTQNNKFVGGIFNHPSSGATYERFYFSVGGSNYYIQINDTSFKFNSKLTGATTLIKVVLFELDDSIMTNLIPT